MYSVPYSIEKITEYLAADNLTIVTYMKTDFPPENQTENSTAPVTPQARRPLADVFEITTTFSRLSGAFQVEVDSQQNGTNWAAGPHYPRCTAVSLELIPELLSRL